MSKTATAVGITLAVGTVAVLVADKYLPDGKVKEVGDKIVSTVEDLADKGMKLIQAAVDAVESISDNLDRAQAK